MLAEELDEVASDSEKLDQIDEIKQEKSISNYLINIDDSKSSKK
jgi:hypothetical protein